MTGPWWHEAACKGADLNLFFPISTGPGSYDDAKAICATCPVRRQCLDDAVNSGSWHGVFGGLAPLERRVLATEMGVINRVYYGCEDKQGTTAGYYRERSLGIEHCGPCLKAYNDAANKRNRRRRARRAAAASEV